MNPNDPPESVSQASALEAWARDLRKEAEQLENRARELTAVTESQNAANKITGRAGRVAVFLGAGASYTFGWPLTNDLLPKILEGLISNNLFEDARINTPQQNAADRQLLTDTLRALSPGLELTPEFLVECRYRMPLVTSLLSMLDFSLAAGHAIVKGLTPEELKDARKLLERAIYEVIARRDIAQGTDCRQSNQSAMHLALWLKQIRSNQTDVGVITSNYDIAMEQAWGFSEKDLTKMESLGIDFGFDWTWSSNDYPPKVLSRPPIPKGRLYKLHGSTNWLRCGLCDRIYINPEVDIAIYAYDRKENYRNMCHCRHVKLEVQIVSPSFVRDMRSPNLTSVWQQALNWLRESDDWIVIGYSFPDEDLNIRSLFTRALASHRKSQSSKSDQWPFITAIQFGRNEQTRTRYEAFFPDGQLTYLTGGLEAFLQAAGPATPSTQTSAP
jgi:NAD-dependent SIR2 family protein deacetylase